MKRTPNERGSFFSDYGSLPE